MPTPVFLTVDTEFAWRYHAEGCDVATIYDRSLEPAGVGLRYQLDMLAAHGLKATFFVDPMPALVYGLDPVRRMVEAVLSAGQEVQLHCHANWTGAHVGDGGASYGRFDCNQYDRGEVERLLSGAVDLIVAAGASRPIAFRAGAYQANEDTLAALAALGFVYDSSHNGTLPGGIALAPDQIAPVRHAGLIELPVTLIEDAAGHFRHFQICAISAREAAAALAHAAAERHAAVTIVSHSFELANRSGTRANAVHVRRFEALCALLDERREELPTVHFADRPALRLGQDDRPLAPDPWRTGLRRAEQLWSNLVSERA